MKKSNPLIVAVAVVALFITSNVDGGTYRDDAPRVKQDYIDHAAQSQYDPVGLLDVGFTCSGTPITDQWVLSAAHCLDASPGSVTFSIGGSDYTGDVSTIAIHPDWNPAGTLADSDLALIKLTTPVVGITPATLYTGTDELDMTGTSVGFGQTGPGTTGKAGSVRPTR